MRNYLDEDRVHYLKGSDGAPQNNISNEKYIELIDEAAEIGVRKVGVVGLGEVMMNEKIMEIFERIKHCNLNGSLTTNGTLFGEGDVRRMVDMNWDLIAISLDGPDAQTQEKLRPSLDSSNSFEEVLKTLELFEYYKEKLRKDKPEIILVPVLNKYNFSKAPEFIELADSYSVDRVEFKPLVTHGFDELKEYKVTEDMKRNSPDTIEKTEKLSEKYNIDTNIGEFMMEEFSERSDDIKNAMEKSTMESDDILSIPCYDPWLKIEVHPGEEIANPCPVPFKEYSEDINEKSLKEIWYGENFNKLRNRIKNGDIPDFCKLCCGGNVLRNKSLREYMDKKNEL